MIRDRMQMFRDFVRQESAAGLILMVVAAAGLLVANSPLTPHYFAIQKVSIGGLTLRYWIIDGLMAAFFLLVGLEIKREMLEGALASWRERALPGVAAVGGMVVPAVIYVLLSQGDPQVLRGWAVPMATDIAFALGVLALLGSRVPLALKVLLTAIAIVDDLGAVLVIALFYSDELRLPALAAAAAVLVLLAMMNRKGVRLLLPYLFGGVLLWFFILQSGVHATLAGVALALTIPLRGDGNPEESGAPLHRLEHSLHPWVAFLVLPVFGFANAGVSWSGVSLAELAGPVPLGVAAGLLLGKPLGIFGFSLLAARWGWLQWPPEVSWRQMLGISWICGIGFTMSLFIGALAFAETPLLAEQAKMGVLLGSALSGVAGAGLLLVSSHHVRGRP
ncbi:MAG TPA: Na+/H+ antiporter NhaA [Gemmatimonadota bacterium]|nr:Na+/H+ antiporter NhaA [Gemmatimonadota bacterium]